MKARDIYLQPGYLFRRMHQISTAAFSTLNTDKTLTPVQFAALLTIRDNPGIDATRLAAAVRLDRTTIGHVIVRLELKQLLIRTEDSLDKRTRQLRITARGSALLDRAGPYVDAVSDRILAPLSPAERAELLRLLQVLDEGATRDEGPA